MQPKETVCECVEQLEENKSMDIDTSINPDDPDVFVFKCPNGHTNIFPQN